MLTPVKKNSHLLITLPFILPKKDGGGRLSFILNPPKNNFYINQIFILAKYTADKNQIKKSKIYILANQNNFYKNKKIILAKYMAHINQKIKLRNCKIIFT